MVRVRPVHLGRTSPADPPDDIRGRAADPKGGDPTGDWRRERGPHDGTGSGPRSSTPGLSYSPPTVNDPACIAGPSRHRRRVRLVGLDGLEPPRRHPVPQKDRMTDTTGQEGRPSSGLAKLPPYLSLPEPLLQFASAAPRRPHSEPAAGPGRFRSLHGPLAARLHPHDQGGDGRTPIRAGRR